MMAYNYLGFLPEKILKIVAQSDIPLSGTEISRSSNIPLSSTLTVLSDLRNKTILRSNRIGKSVYYSLSRVELRQSLISILEQFDTLRKKFEEIVNGIVKRS